jgi:hypothetical protein
MNEYRNRDDAYFTITSYYTNMYKDEQSNNLMRSILHTETKQIPNHIKGARPCLLVPNSLHGDKDIPICLLSEEDENNLLGVYSFFLGNCVAGLEKINKLAVARSLINCSGKKNFPNPLKLLKKLREKYYRNRDPYQESKTWFHPGSDRVPGTNPPIPQQTLNELIAKALAARK